MIRSFWLTACTLLLSVLGWSQLPDDALRYAYPLSGGTARNQAIGGAMASLGGDISAAHINPAGIGFYKNKEFVLSPSFNLLNNKYQYLGTANNSRENGIAYGTSGFVFGHAVNSRYTKTKGSAFAITVNNIANYRDLVQYQGNNSQSSWSEQYVEQLVNDEASLDAADNNYIFGSSLAFRSFLVDSIAGAGGRLIGYQSLVPVGGPGSVGVSQNNLIETRGGAQEVAFTFGNSIMDKIHLGISVGIPIYSYERNQVYREEDLSGNPNNDFDFFEFRENYRTTGAGFNLKGGIIVRPVERLRLGLAFHTPSWLSMRDVVSSEITTDSEGYIRRVYPGLNLPNINTVTSDELKGNSLAGEYDYNLQTPYRILGSFSYVFNEVRDVKRQKGFITADLEYVNYRSTRYRAFEEGNADDVRYYEEVNDIIRSRFKGAVNIRVGGEMKFEKVMARLGFAHLGSPYANDQLRGSRTLLSGGLGYRNRGLFVDATYVHGIINNTQVVYYLNDKPSPVADGRNLRGQVVVTFGVKFG